MHLLSSQVMSPEGICLVDGFSEGEVLLAILEEHVSFRVLALGLPDREVLCVTLRNTFHLGRSLIG